MNRPWLGLSTVIVVIVVVGTIVSSRSENVGFPEVTTPSFPSARDDDGGIVVPSDAHRTQPSSDPPGALIVEDSPIQRSAVDEAPLLVPLYQIYQADIGETVFSIAELFGISPEYLVVNNPDIGDAWSVAPGQQVVIPSGNGILHEVRYGENLADIGARYGVSVADIVAIEANGISDPVTLANAQTIFIPNARIPEPGVSAAP